MSTLTTRIIRFVTGLVGAIVSFDVRFFWVIVCANAFAKTKQEKVKIENYTFTHQSIKSNFHASINPIKLLHGLFQGIEATSDQFFQPSKMWANVAGILMCMISQWDCKYDRTRSLCSNNNEIPSSGPRRLAKRCLKCFSVDVDPSAPSNFYHRMR